MTLNELFDHGILMAQKIFTEQHEIHPMWIGETADGNIVPIMVQMPPHNEREGMAAALRALFCRKSVTQYVSLLESWLLVLPPETTEIPGIIHNHPDRREIVFIQAEDNQGNNCSGHFFILRPEHGKPTLSPFHRNEISETEGRFVGLLQKREIA